MSEPRRIDLNADVGEGYDDRQVATSVSSLSVACGAHAGDESTMRSALALARDLGLAAGAHPGYADPQRFGRVELGLPSAAIGATVLRQIGELAVLARESGLRLAYVKPHGALYHRATVDRESAEAIVSAVATVDDGLAVVGFPGSRLLEEAESVGLEAIPESFADRAYTTEGRLLDRGEPGAVLGDAAAAAQALSLAARGAQTICVHGDSPGAAEVARAARRALEAEGYAVEPFALPGRYPALPELRVVGAAMIESGRVLLTRRAAGRSMAGKWEFPGGKVEEGENQHEALVRELREELGVVVEPAERIGRGTSLHDGRRIVLEVFEVRRVGGELTLHEHEEHGWFRAGELAALDWPEADLPVLPALVRRLATDG
jgi:UPF0271 protein